MEEKILEQLKKLQAIQADKRFTERSRAMLIGTRRPLRVWDIILKNIELGASVALAGILIIIIFGGFSAWKFLSPLKLSNLDTTGLKAEAQAIDMQIDLTNLNYNEIISTTQPLSTRPKSIAAPKTQTSTVQIKTPEASTTTTTDDSLTIEEALKKLSE